MTFDDIWKDAVWSKVIGGLMVSAILGIIAIIRKAQVAAAMRVLFGSGSVSNVEPATSRPIVTVVNIDCPPIDPNPPQLRKYPLKCYVEMRNDSQYPIDVRMIDYRVNTIHAKQVVIEVLQVKFNKWFPAPDGWNRIAVYPGQMFRAWIPIDENGAFTNSAILNLRGRIGTLLLSVNDHEIPVQF